VLTGDAVKPDHLSAGVDLAVHDTAVLVAVKPARAKAEGTDQEFMRGLDVFIDQQWDNRLSGGHADKLLLV